MEWRGEGIVLEMRPHGEGGAVLEVFTEGHGRHAGLVHGGQSRRMRPVLQPGNRVALEWHGRLESHLGRFAVEPLENVAARLLDDPLALAALRSLTSLLAFTLPERQPHAGLYRRTAGVIGAIGRVDEWPQLYLLWELALLEEMGFGLDLGRCAVTGRREGLAFVSPKTGRAVTREGAGGWTDRLLPLPPVLLGEPAVNPGEVAAGLEITGHFLTHHLAPALGNRPLPPARERFAARLKRAADGSA